MKDTKKELLYTGIELFKEKGYDNVSVNEICQTLGLTKGAFYHHYDSKDDLLLKYYVIKLGDSSSYLAEMAEMDDSKEKIWKMLTIGIDASIDLGKDLLRSSIEADLKQGNKVFSPYSFFDIQYFLDYQNNVIETINRCKKQQIITTSFTTDALIFLFYSSTSAILARWSATEESFDFWQEITRIFTTLFI